MRGPYLITALPEDLFGLETELFAALHGIALAQGRPAGPLQKIACFKTPLLVCVLATTLPDQMRMTISRMPGALFDADAVMIFLTADGHNYVLFDASIDAEELRAIARDHGNGP